MSAISKLEMRDKIYTRISGRITGNGLRAQLIRGALGVGGLKLAAMPLALATSIVLARGLGAEGYGQYAFITAVVTVLCLPTGAGLAQLVTRETARLSDRSDWSLFRGLLRRAHQWVIVVSALLIALAVATALARSGAGNTERWTLLTIAIFIIPFFGLNAVRSGALRGLGKATHSQAPELLVRSGLHLGIVGVLLLSGLLTPASALGSYVVATASAFLVGAYLLSMVAPAPSRIAAPTYETRHWLRSLVPFTLLVGVSTFNAKIAILFLGWLGSDEEIAAMRVAESGSSLVAFSLTVVNVVIAPHVARAYQGSDNQMLQKLARQAARVALLIAVPVALPLILLGAPIIRFIFGQEYAEIAAVPMAILALAQLINVAFGFVGMFLNMSGYEKDTLIGLAMGLLVTCGCALLFIPKWGGAGAATAVAIGVVVWNVLLVIKVRQRLSLRATAF